MRTPGELPTLPGGSTYPAIQGAQPSNGLSQGFFGQAPAPSTFAQSFGSGALGLAQAAVVAGGLGLATAAGLAISAPTSTGANQSAGPIYNSPSFDDTGSGPGSGLGLGLNGSGPSMNGPDQNQPDTGGPQALSTPPDTPQPGQSAFPAIPVPEPSTIFLFAAGTLAAVGARLHARIYAQRHTRLYLRQRPSQSPPHTGVMLP